MPTPSLWPRVPGRTEVIRSATPAAVAFTKAFTNGASTKEDRLAALRCARARSRVIGVVLIVCVCLWVGVHDRVSACDVYHVPIRRAATEKHTEITKNALMGQGVDR